MKVLVFLPTYNEGDNIGELIDYIQSLDFNKEILIVDDNSTDKTIETVKNKQKKFKNITLIIRNGIKGRGLAGIDAFRYFTTSDSDVLIEMDADFSHHPKYIINLLKYIPYYDVILGSRLIKNGRETGRSIFRKITTLFANALIRIVFFTRIKDCTSGFRAIKKSVVLNFNLDKFISKDYIIVEESFFAFLQSNARIKEIPYIFHDREEGLSKLNMLKMILTFLGVFRIRLRGKKIIKKRK
ncbi:MAG: polyprenol monophosphomannose synthase [Promethearchaeota archaeon]